jgi:RIO-like serine/threonine protein kinase
LQWHLLRGFISRNCSHSCFLQIGITGQRVGTGKESDVYLAVDPSGTQCILKIHRLGRTSFRNVRKKRDYFGKAGTSAHSWLFLSRLSALKEYAFMKALYDVGYPTPTPIAHNRHIVCMSLVRGMPLYQIFPKQLSVEQAADIYEQSIGMAARLAQHGLVHCDLNEFNVLVDLSGVQSMATASDDPYVRHSGQSVAPEKSVGMLSKQAWEQSMEAGDKVLEAMPEPVARLENGEPKPIVTLIDFPQMISTKHPNAKELYERDLGCLRRFFELKLLCTIPDDLTAGTVWESLVQSENEDIDAEQRLDKELKASGYSKDMKQDLELYYFNNNESSPNGISSPVEEGSDDEESDDEDREDINDAAAEIRSNDSADELEATPETITKEIDQFNENADSVAEDGQVEVEVANLLLDDEELQSLTRDQLEERVKDRVRRQLEEQRRKSRKQHAFRKGNNNKTYVKGKRVMTDTGF